MPRQVRTLRASIDTPGVCGRELDARLMRPTRAAIWERYFEERMSKREEAGQFTSD
jgi:hypothetical protein